MTVARRSVGAGERGLLRGCCAVLVALGVVCVAALVLLVRLTGTPDLGPAPAGPDDGGSAASIAATLATRVAAQLIEPGATEAAVLVSERDLSILATADNPEPSSFTDVAVRARSDQLWVDADSHLGPLPVVVTARLSVSLRPAGSIVTDVQEVDVGDQTVPGFMRSAVDPRGNALFSLSPLLSGSQLSTFGLECLTVLPGRGVELGFHAPLSPADPGYCTAHPVPAGSVT